MPRINFPGDFPTLDLKKLIYFSSYPKIKILTGITKIIKNGIYDIFHALFGHGTIFDEFLISKNVYNSSRRFV